ncbi:Fungalysin metallopeptidase-domain-containing protein [Lactarius hengduanensis]|nr:Fungalysin metallopeptidase-domain-containing protein [Lactarius hengduanensis]
MASFSKLLSSVLIALLYSSTANANPWPLTSKHATHRTRAVGADGSLKLEGFGVEGLDHPLARRAGNFDIAAASVSFLASKLGIQQNDIHFRTSAKAEVAQHAFLKQQIYPVANVAFSDDGKVLSFSSSFVKPSGSAEQTPTVSLNDAIATAEKALDGTHNGHPATLEFLIQPDGSAVLTHVIQIQNERAGTWVEAFVDAHSNKVVSVTDFVAKASYRVLPFNEEILTEGFQTLTDPQDLAASSLGCTMMGQPPRLRLPGTTSFAAKGSTATSQSSATLNFIYTRILPRPDGRGKRRRGSCERILPRELAPRRYGGLWQRSRDRERAGPAGTDNADFSTPPDGQSPHMRMFLWDFTSPGRDGALENDIVIHEYTHGGHHRMTGGGTGRCLQTTEAGGMGEGWSDAFANWAHQGATTQDFVLGQYVINDPAGIRSHPYSTSAATNPLRYSSLKTLTEVHDIGEVWANILHNVYAALVTAHGGLLTARTNPGGTEGNVVFPHLFLDASASPAVQPPHSSRPAPHGSKRTQTDLPARTIPAGC